MLEGVYKELIKITKYNKYHDIKKKRGQNFTLIKDYEFKDIVI
jgi:hypothetical protein